jgi:hypothetical protein
MGRQKRVGRSGSRTFSLVAALFGALTATGTARADRAFDVAMARPAMDAYGMMVVERARTPGKFEFGTSTIFGWAKNPFRPTLSDQNNGLMESRFDLIQHQLTVDLGFSLGLTDFLSVAVVMPMGVNLYDQNPVGEPAVPQQPSAMNPTGLPRATGLYAGQPRQTVPISAAGVRDPRVGVKARFYGGRYFEIGTLLELTLPLGDRNSFLGENNATFRPQLLAGVMFWRVNIAMAFGAVVREGVELYEPSTPPTMPQVLRFQSGHELTYGVGLSVLAHQMLSLGIEGFGTIPVVGQATSATTSILGAIYFRPTEKWRITVAGGGGVLPDSPRNADGRLIVGLAYSPSPREGGLR